MTDRRALLRSLSRQTSLLSLGYLALGLGWILLSDRLLGALVRDPDLLVRLSVYKGFAFVAVTATGLGVLLHRMTRKIDDALAVAERHEAERNAEQAFASSLIEAMPGIFYFYDEAGRFLRWNRNFEHVSGYTPEEMARMHPLDFFAGDDRALVQARIAEVFREGESSVEAAFVSKDGTRSPYFFTGNRVDFGGRTCLVGVGVDISERVRVEEALRRSEERYRTTLDSILEGCQLLDFDYRYLYLNDAAAVQNRRPNAELLGRSMPEAWPGIEHTDVFAMLTRCLRERVPVQSEVDFRFPDGHSGWFEVRGQPVPEGIFVLSIDISERKRMEQALKELNQGLELKVAERTGELATALERAEAADRLKSAFLATMSHELRTPLNSIIGFTGIVLQGLAGPVQPEQDKQLRIVRSSAQHLLALINDVLDISKIEAGQLEVRPADFDLGACIHRVAESVEPLAAKKDLSLRVQAPESLGTIHSDPRRFEQILLNLLNNAIKFTERGSVVLHAERLGDGTPRLRVQVVDTGIGIKREDLSCLFLPFRQLDSGLQRQHEGTGLGLAICRRLAELLGGTISAQSVYGQGSTFTLELPLSLRSPTLRPDAAPPVEPDSAQGEP